MKTYTKTIFIALSYFLLSITPVKAITYLDLINQQNKKIEELQSQITQTTRNNSEAENSLKILERTNDALNQRWTPMTVLLAALATLFGVITILWGIVFAFGYTFFLKISRQKAQMMKDATELRRKGKEVIEFVESEGNKLIGQFNDQGKTLEEKTRELKDFQEKTKQAIEKLEENTLVSVSASSVLGTLRINNLEPGIINAKVCTKCGSVFTDPPKKIFDPMDLYTTSLRSYSMFPTPETLCPRCKAEAVV